MSTKAHTKRASAILAVAVALVTTACSDQPRSRLLEPHAVAPGASHSSGSRVALMYRLMAVNELESMIREADRRVFIKFKEPGASEGVDRYGVSLVSAATLRMAKSELEARGLDIEWQANYHPLVMTRLPLGSLSEIRNLPFVDVVEPVGTVRLESQDTTWNVEKVRAPQGWWFGKGNGVKVLVIDTGVDLPHTDLSVTQRMNFTDDEEDDDRVGHGTHVAGIIARQTLVGRNQFDARLAGRRQKDRIVDRASEPHSEMVGGWK